MRTKLPIELNTLQDVKDYLTALYNNNEHYHPDDNAEDCFPFATHEETEQMNRLMDKTFEIAASCNFDVYLFILHLNPDYPGLDA